MSSFRAIPLTIGTAADGLSNAIDLEDQNFAGFVMPAAWTAAGMTFLIGLSLNGTYSSIYDETNAEVVISSGALVAGRTILFADAMSKKLRAVRFLKLRSHTSASPIAQAATRLFTIYACK